jgi:glycosyltransferase involved in cell wall biosynthesis
MPSAMRGRFHPGLTGARVEAANLTALANEIVFRIGPGCRESRTSAHNSRFGGFAASAIGRTAVKSKHVVVFAYSYAALAAFRAAKRQGWYTVLGQIDPGPVEEDIVAALHESDHGLGEFHRFPPAYWENWREEIRLSDLVLANSNWSLNCLKKTDLDKDKMRLVPVSYTTPMSVFKRTYPDHFTRERPLRVLFLGQIGARKGAHVAYDACRRLKDEAVEFTFVGPEQLKRPRRSAGLDNVRWAGSVARTEVGKFYAAADVFLFPTLSDGFGITQLEAQAWALPVIASRNCGEVVAHGRNGLVLDKISPEGITSALLFLLRNPATLPQLSANAAVGPDFTLGALRDALVDIEGELLAQRCRRAEPGRGE